MPLHSLSVAICLLTLLFSAQIYASNPQQLKQQLQQQAITTGLSEHPEWLALLHYRKGFFSTAKSQADDANFFVTASGATDPHKELRESIKALFETSETNDHFVCKFPARARWLINALSIPASALPNFQCPKLDEFRSTLGAKRVSLIFAATYLNSPSSMFGHTFLRLDNSTEEDANLLLSYTVSYAADVQERDNELMFAYRGIFGGYPGVTAVVPYYEKLKQYIDMENRDIWEFQLNLNQVEIDRLVDHAWELMDKNFDYYFFDENCAYRLLALLDVGRPGTGLIDDVSYQAIPSDTVRWVVSKDLVADVKYRPSTSSTVQSQISQLSATESAAVLSIAKQQVSIDEILSTVDLPASQARILDATYEYTRYDTVLSERTREETAKLSHQLLIKRSALGIQPAFEAPKAPKVRDDQGHDTFRITAKIGSYDDNGFAEIELRPAYHDLTDIPDGYPEGTQLRFLATRLRFWENESKLSLEELTLIDINSISPRDRFFKPTSWKVSVGGERSDLTESRPFAAYLKGGSGYATKLADGLLFGYLQGSLQAHRDLTSGYALGPGLEVGWIRQKSNLQTIIAADYEHYIEGNNAERYQLKFQQGIRIDNTKQVLLSLFRNKSTQEYSSEWQIELRHYW